MLSDVLTFVLALAVCGMAVLCVYCYRLGLRDGGFARRNGEARRLCTADRGRARGCARAGGGMARGQI